MAITVKTFEKLGDAASALASDRGARFLGGGTLVMRAVNEGDVSITTIVRSTDPSVSQIRPAGARIEIGAGVTMAQILANRDLAFLHPAARTVGGPAVRGNGDGRRQPVRAVALRRFHDGAAGARCDGVGHRGLFRERNAARGVPGRRASAAARAGLVASVSFPRLGNPDAFRFRKVSRVKPKGIAVLSIAALLPVAGGRIAGARVAYGAMAPTPMRAKAAERALEGRSLDEAGISAALAACAEGTAPADDAIASAWYRREVLPVHLKRLLLGQPGVTRT